MYHKLDCWLNGQLNGFFYFFHLARTKTTNTYEHVLARPICYIVNHLKLDRAKEVFEDALRYQQVLHLGFSSVDVQHVCSNCDSIICTQLAGKNFCVLAVSHCVHALWDVQDLIGKLNFIYKFYSLFVVLCNKCNVQQQSQLGYRRLRSVRFDAAAGQFFCFLEHAVGIMLVFVDESFHYTPLSSQHQQRHLCCSTTGCESRLLV